MGGCASKPKDSDAKVPSPESAAASEEAPKVVEAEDPTVAVEKVESKEEALVKDSEPKPETSVADASLEVAAAEPSEAKPEAREQPTKAEIPEKNGEQPEKPTEQVVTDTVQASETTPEQKPGTEAVAKKEESEPTKAPESSQT